MDGIEIKLKFHLTRGNDLLLLENDIFANAGLIGSGNLLKICSGVALSTTEFQLFSYTLGDEKNKRTPLYVLTSLSKSFLSLYATMISYCSSLRTDKSLDSEMDREMAKLFAFSLHSQSHMSMKDRKKFYCRASILNDTSGEGTRGCIRSLCLTPQNRKTSTHEEDIVQSDTR